MEQLKLHVKRLLKLRVALSAVLCDPKVTPKKQDRELLLKDNSWRLAEELTKLLEPFEAVTTVISGQSYVTLSLLLPITSQLHFTVSAAAESSASTVGRKVAEGLKSEIARKFPDA